MKVWKLLFNLLLITTAASGQQYYVYHSSLEESAITNFINNRESNTVDLQLMADASVTEDELKKYKELLREWTAHLKNKQKKTKDQGQFVEWLFYKVQRKLLKSYTSFSTFNETLTSGNYDCLSGTTLYATLLSQLGIDFEIIETNYHIYLKLELEGGGRVLLESTDPLAGFIDNEKEIATRLEHYEKDNIRSSGNPEKYAFRSQTNNAVDFIGLVGLQYYNASVNAFNSGNLELSILLFEKAGIFYNSQRFVEFGFVLANTLIEDNEMTTSNKREFLKRISVVDRESVASAF